MQRSSLKRILMIEDDADIQAIARMALETLGGFTVQGCYRGQEALEVAPTFDPDLILLDVMMPGMDGPTTLEHLRRMPQTASTPVIFMTAKVLAHEVDEYKALGAAAVIRKPFNPVTLSATVNTIWENCRVQA